MLPYLAFAGPATVLLALASAQGRFFLTAFSPLLFNIALIAVMIVLIFAHRDAGFVAPALAATVGIAGFLQLLILALRRGERVATPLRVSFDAEMRGFLTRAIPGMVASSAPQLLIVAGAIIASTSPSAVSWLYFANRLIELPLGIVGVAMGTVLIPELTRALHGGDKSAIVNAESRGTGTGGGPGAARHARSDRTERADRAAVVRARRVHGGRYAINFSGTDLSCARPARACAGESAVAGFFRARKYLCAAGRDAEGLLSSRSCWPCCSAISSVRAALPLRLPSAPGAMRLSLIRQGASTFGFSLDAAARRRLPRIVAAALMLGALLWLAADFAVGVHGLVQAVMLLVLIAAAIAAYGVLLAAFDVTGWREVVNAVRQRETGDLRPSLAWQTLAA